MPALPLVVFKQICQEFDMHIHQFDMHTGHIVEWW